jgi:hypothetical protein
MLRILSTNWPQLPGISLSSKLVKVSVVVAVVKLLLTRRYFRISFERCVKTVNLGVYGLIFSETDFSSQLFEVTRLLYPSNFNG